MYTYIFVICTWISICTSTSIFESSGVFPLHSWHRTAWHPGPSAEALRTAQEEAEHGRGLLPAHNRHDTTSQNTRVPSICRFLREPNDVLRWSNLILKTILLVKFMIFSHGHPPPPTTTTTTPGPPWLRLAAGRACSGGGLVARRPWGAAGVCPWAVFNSFQSPCWLLLIDDYIAYYW